VALAAALAAALRLPLAAIVVVTLLTTKSGVGVSPLIIVAAAVAYLTAERISGPPAPGAASPARHRAREGDPRLTAAST
jgi:H+/Cl- antiporter ClcA